MTTALWNCSTDSNSPGYFIISEDNYSGGCEFPKRNFIGVTKSKSAAAKFVRCPDMMKLLSKLVSLHDDDMLTDEKITSIVSNAKSLLKAADPEGSFSWADYADIPL